MNKDAEIFTHNSSRGWPFTITIPSSAKNSGIWNTAISEPTKKNVQPIHRTDLIPFLILFSFSPPISVVRVFILEALYLL